jgi:anti-sigma factor RsiW
MTCREATEFLESYLAGELAPEARRRFEAHLAHCRDCVEYLRSYETTVLLARDACSDSTDPALAVVPEGLVRAILAARHGGER